MPAEKKKGAFSRPQSDRLVCLMRRDEQAGQPRSCQRHSEAFWSTSSRIDQREHLLFCDDGLRTRDQSAIGIPL